MDAQLELKKRFAKELLNNAGLDPFKPALAVADNDMGFACIIAKQWPNDPIVKEEIEKLKGTGDVLSDVTEEQYEKMILACFYDNLDSYTRDSKVKALKLLGQFKG